MPQDDSPVRRGELLGKITEIQRAGLVFRPVLAVSPDGGLPALPLEPVPARGTATTGTTLPE
jgi:hypothetical protein